jgi:DNA-binding response OmpR family regulator
MSHESAPDHPSDHKLGRVLLIDDNEAARQALARFLEVSGFEVTAVGDGNTFLTVLRGDPPPDFVLTDLLLPDADGRELARIACQVHPRPVVAMITGWEFDAEPLDAQALGIDHVFLKPVQTQELVDKLIQLRQQKGDGEPAADESA